MEGISLENKGRLVVMGFCDEIILSADNKTLKGACGVIPSVAYGKALVVDDKALPWRNLLDTKENVSISAKLPVETLLEFLDEPLKLIVTATSSF